jgi:hypothetical protein
MLPKDATQTEVEKLVMGDETVPSPVETPAPTPEPKPEDTPAPVEAPEAPVEIPLKPAEPVNVDKLQQQVENLNIALKKEREEGKSETQALKKQLEDSTVMLERLKGVFAPETPPEPATLTEPVYLTPEQAEEFWEKKEQERAQVLEEQKRADAIKSEVNTLETKWDGKEGKPKYDDAEVLEWQKSHERLYLSPTEAFSFMRNAEIVDWEVKQRLSGRTPTQEVEKPSIAPGEHTPVPVTIKTEAETRAAVIEAMNDADAEI